MWLRASSQPSSGELEMVQDSVAMEASPQAQALSPLVLSSRVDRLLATIVDIVVGFFQIAKSFPAFLDGLVPSATFDRT
jgi:hypothetical protein